MLTLLRKLNGIVLDNDFIDIMPSIGALPVKRVKIIFTEDVKTLLVDWMLHQGYRPGQALRFSIQTLRFNSDTEESRFSIIVEKDTWAGLKICNDTPLGKNLKRHILKMITGDGDPRRVWDVPNSSITLKIPENTSAHDIIKARQKINTLLNALNKNP